MTKPVSIMKNIFLNKFITLSKNNNVPLEKIFNVGDDFLNIFKKQKNQINNMSNKLNYIYLFLSYFNIFVKNNIKSYLSDESI